MSRLLAFSREGRSVIVPQPRRLSGSGGAGLPFLLFTGGSLPAEITYLRAGWGRAWVAGTGQPKLHPIAADTPRFAVDAQDLSMRAIGLMLETASVNYAGYNRGTTRTGWIASGFGTPTAVEGCDQSGTKALRLIAAVDGATYTLATGMPVGAGVYVYSICARALADRSGAWALGKPGYGKIWITMACDGVVEERDISADLQAFLADEVTPAWVQVFVTGYSSGAGPTSIGLRVDEAGSGLDIDFAQLEPSLNNRGAPTTPIGTEGVASASRATDQITITLPGVGAFTLTGDDLARYYDENDLAYRDIADWRDREQDCVASIALQHVSGLTYALTLSTAWRNLPNSGRQLGQPSPIVQERIYENDGSVSGVYPDQMFPRGYTFNAVFA